MNFMPRVVQAFTTRQRRPQPEARTIRSISVLMSATFPERVHENQIPPRTRFRIHGRCAGDGSAECMGRTWHLVHGADRRSLSPGVDALVTDVPGVLLFLLFADCVPVYFYDPAHRAVGIAHSGWRGADRNIARATLRAMTDAFGTQPSACLAAIGPCIGGETV